MPKLLILCGIPHSGKRKCADELKSRYEILSRDIIRDNLFGRNCFITNRVEENVTQEFNFKLKKAYLCRLNIIISNTNCKEEYIDRIIAESPPEYDVELKFFHCSLWKAYLRNYFNFLRGGRYIPFYIMKKMKKGFDSINKTKYANLAQIL